MLITNTTRKGYLTVLRLEPKQVPETGFNTQVLHESERLFNPRAVQVNSKLAIIAYQDNTGVKCQIIHLQKGCKGILVSSFVSLYFWRYKYSLIHVEPLETFILNRDRGQNPPRR